MTVATARPAISADLVRQHIDRAASLLPTYAAQGVLFFRKSNILGFTGVPLEPSDRLVCGLLNADGRIAFVVPAFEVEMAGNLPTGSELVAWEENDDPYAATAEAARLLGIDRAAILLDGQTWLSAHARLQTALPMARLTTDPGLIDTIRVTKSDEEIAAIRAACEDTAKIFPLVSQRLRVGITEADLAREVMESLAKAGVSGFGHLIQGGESASVPHQPTGQRRFLNGDGVIVDFVAQRDGYLGDMTRTFAVDGISEELRQAYTVVREAQRAAIRTVRPGITCQEVDRAAREVIERAGLGDYFSHRLGHGIGLDVHEPPYLVAGNPTLLEPGMCTTIEPGVYVPGRFGIRIEDVIVVTHDGCEVLSKATPTDVSEAFE